MAKKPTDFTFDLKSMHLFDDAVTTDFNSQLAGIVADCRKRPSCAKDRKIALTVEMEPSEADPEDVIVRVTVSSKIPAAKHITRRARSTMRNQLQLQLDGSDEVDDEEE